MEHRWSTGAAPVLCVVVAGAIVGAMVGGFTDLHVYRFAGQSLLDGDSLTGTRDPVMGLPFTYPPFAALLMVPLALLPGWASAGLMTGASVGALWLALRVVRREIDPRRAGWLLAVLTVAALALEPVWQTLSFGQVNLILMAAVLVDVLRPERRSSGLLLGVVIGIKLTPLVLVVLLVIVGRRAMAARAAAAFAATVAVGFLAAPGSSEVYWGERLVEAGRVGPPELAHTQSAYGLLTRLLDREPPTLLWLVIAGGLALAALAMGAVWWRRGDPVLGVSLAAVGMLLASPVSWSHHWVWAVPLLLALWRRSRGMAAVVCVVLVARPFVWLPYGEGRELDWSPVQHVVGNAYLWCAVAVLVWAAQAARPTITRDVGAPGITVGGQSQESSQGR